MNLSKRILLHLRRRHVAERIRTFDKHSHRLRSESVFAAELSGDVREAFPRDLVVKQLGAFGCE